MSPEDTALFEQAKDLYNTGKKQQAYQQFCALYPANKEDTSLLCWIGYSTPNLDEAQRALADVERLKPNHPSLPKLRDRVSKLQQAAAYVPVKSTPPKLKMKCYHCGYKGVPEIHHKISTGGWVTFVVLLLVFFPLCWIGLLIKKDIYVCAGCGIEMGSIRY